jgi:hypothetical protein
MRGQYADQVRDYVRREYVEPARRRGDSTVQIVAGKVLEGLHSKGFGTDRAPLVCSALKTRKFLEENKLVLEEAKGPAKMQSTTVTYTYRLTVGDESPAASSFLQLRGAGKNVFAKLGGGEAFLRKERAQFYGPGPKE